MIANLIGSQWRVPPDQLAAQVADVLPLPPTRPRRRRSTLPYPITHRDHESQAIARGWCIRADMRSRIPPAPLDGLGEVAGCLRPD